MKKYRILLSLTALILGSMACQTASRDDSSSTGPDQQDNLETETFNTYNGEWPIPEGAYLITDFGRFLHFQVDMSQNEVMDFYLTEMQARGYKDRPISSDYDGSDGFISIVFDGHESGRQILVTVQDRDSDSVYVEIGLTDM
jgi:hypothetical protein